MWNNKLCICVCGNEISIEEQLVLFKNVGFELNLLSKPGRHENDAYFEMPFERYLTEAYKRACRVAKLVSNAVN